MTDPFLVIGVGNPLRRDDGVGPHVARALAARGLPALAHPGEGAALIELWRGRDRVVVIDATRSGAAPGTIIRLDAAAKALPAAFSSHSTHQFGLAEAVETARVLCRLPRCLTVYGIEGLDFRAGEGLSTAASRAAAAVIGEIAGR